MPLTEFDLEVIAYAHERGEDSAKVYERLAKLEPIGYRDVLGEKIFLQKLQKLKEIENAQNLRTEMPEVSTEFHL